MTALLIQNAQLIDPESGAVSRGNLRCDNGLIIEISPSPLHPHSGETTLDAQDKYLAPGIIDIGVKVCEPGERHKESFKSAGMAAAAGGITTIVTRPDTQPAIDNPESLEFVTRRANQATPIKVIPMAALTKQRAGQEMSEISFLMDAGAIAFTDCDQVVSNPKVFARALRYAGGLGALVIAHTQDPILSEGAAATSGKFASLRGLAAVSGIAERMALDRDIALIEMTDAHYHADQITTARALPALARAKANGLDITAGTSIHHLTLNEFDIADYRTFFKVKPPLRTESDRRAVVEAVQSGLIDIISSMHTPQDEESKRLPFEEAASGAVALETLLPAALRLFHAGDLELPQLFRALSYNPAKRLRLPTGRLQCGAPADLVLFDAHAPFVLDRFTLLSKSKNTPFDGARLQGRVLATFVAGRPVFQAVSEAAR